MSAPDDTKPGGEPEARKQVSKARTFARFMVYAVAACGVLFVIIGIYEPEFVKKQKPSWDDFQSATKDYQKSQDKLLELIQKKTGQSGEQ